MQKISLSRIDGFMKAARFPDSLTTIIALDGGDAKVTVNDLRGKVLKDVQSKVKAGQMSSKDIMQLKDLVSYELPYDYQGQNVVIPVPINGNYRG